MTVVNSLNIGKSYFKNESNSGLILKRWLIFIPIIILGGYLFVFGRRDFYQPKKIKNKLWHNCSLQLVESIPIGLNFSDDSPKFLSTFDAWKILLNKVEKTLDIGAFYFTLRGEDVINDTSSALGEDIFNEIVRLGKKPFLEIRIAESAPSNISPDSDTEVFRNLGVADVRSVDFPKLFGGVLHTKLWVVDKKHFYLGSANMDWRSLTQVKEMGVLGTNCGEMANDISKIFSEYWFLGSSNSTVPNTWPESYSTKYNYDSPMWLQINNLYRMSGFISSSPPALSATGRMNDIDSIVITILTAKKYINIAVMDYFPLMIYSDQLRYWPVIDNALRKAAIENKVEIKLLISRWEHSNPIEDNYLRSLTALSDSVTGVNISIKRFVVPEDGIKIPFTRVNHNKYMVTENRAYIGTSNWSGDYFINTAGVGLIFTDHSGSNKSLTFDLKSVFDRDWNSVYAQKFQIIQNI